MSIASFAELLRLSHSPARHDSINLAPASSVTLLDYGTITKAQTVLPLVEGPPNVYNQLYYDVYTDSMTAERCIEYMV